MAVTSMLSTLSRLKIKTIVVANFLKVLSIYSYFEIEDNISALAIIDGSD